MTTLCFVFDAGTPLLVSAAFAAFNFAVGLQTRAEHLLMLLVEPPTAPPFAGP
jgi:hypothetical protein